MKKTLRSAMLSTICMLVVAVMSLTGVTYAWFTSNTTADVTGMTMEVSAAGAGLEVSEDGSDWGTTIQFETEDDENLIPVSTVNAVNFFKADANPDNTEITTTSADKATTVWSEEVWMQNTGEGTLTIQLTGEVFSISEGDTSGKETYKAARIAVFDGETLLYIYGDEEEYLGVNGEGTFNSDASAGSETIKLGTVQNYQSDVAQCTLTIPGVNEAGTPQPKKFTILVWIEGQDPECISNNANSSFDVELHFAVVQ